MLSAYLDECGQESKGLVIVAGFIGDKSAWDKCAAAWHDGFKGTQRKSLHLKKFRFERDSEKRLLEHLGPIPEECGLKRVSGSVNVADYHNLVAGTVAELHSQGYAVALVPLVLAIRDAIHSDERFEFIFEEQTALGFYRDKLLSLISYMLSIDPALKDGVQKSQLVSWRTVTKGSTRLCEPADYLCYHLAHKSAEPDSVRTKWTAPITGNGKICIRHLTREKVRDLFSIAPSLRPQDPEELELFKQEIRQGNYDPWEELLAQKKSKAV